MGRVISVTHVGQGDVPAECRGQDTEQGVSCVTRLVSSSGCPHEQGHSCLPTAQPPGGAPSADSLGCGHGPGTHVCRQDCVPQQRPPSCRQPRPLLTALPQECVTLNGDYVIQETFHVFLGVCSGNVARTAVHTAVHILGQLPESWAARGQLCPQSREDGPLRGHPYPAPAWRPGGNIPGAGIWVRGRKGSWQGTEAYCPPPRPWALLAKHCL